MATNFRFPATIFRKGGGQRHKSSEWLQVAIQHRLSTATLQQPLWLWIRVRRPLTCPGGPAARSVPTHFRWQLTPAACAANPWRLRGFLLMSLPSGASDARCACVPMWLCSRLFIEQDELSFGGNIHGHLPTLCVLKFVFSGGPRSREDF
jgi:hypothetical protein